MSVRISLTLTAAELRAVEIALAGADSRLSYGRVPAEQDPSPLRAATGRALAKTRSALEVVDRKRERHEARQEAGR